jgi:hypothetical protein
MDRYEASVYFVKMLKEISDPEKVVVTSQLMYEPNTFEAINNPRIGQKRTNPHPSQSFFREIIINFINGQIYRENIKSGEFMTWSQPIAHLYFIGVL